MKTKILHPVSIYTKVEEKYLTALQSATTVISGTTDHPHKYDMMENSSHVTSITNIQKHSLTGLCKYLYTSPSWYNKTSH